MLRTPDFPLAAPGRGKSQGNGSPRVIFRAGWGALPKPSQEPAALVNPGGEIPFFFVRGMPRGRGDTFCEGNASREAPSTVSTGPI